MRKARRFFRSAVFWLGVPVFAAVLKDSIGYTPSRDASPIVQAMAEVAPTELREATSENFDHVWREWVKNRDSAIRARLAQGDVDSVINFLMFGVSFTQAPRLTSNELKLLAEEKSTGNEGNPSEELQQVLRNRIRDLVKGMVEPRQNERLSFSRKVLEAAGIDFATPKGLLDAQEYLVKNAMRVLKEQNGYQQAIAEAKSLNDATEEFAERSTLYRERGLSLDTSLPPDYALEVALKVLRDRGLLHPGTVRRVGIIGPGLDFTDKQEGYDFYPTQTVQPFAVMDSLLRLGLVNRNALVVDTLDLSPRINDHVERARKAALAGHGYTIQVPRDPSRNWKPEIVEYWKKFGDQIGTSATPVSVPGSLRGITLKSVRVDPEYVKRLRAMDLNIVLQREDSSTQPQFDLLIATNILVYYDTFEQELALTNIQAMLRPGGFLLTNNLLLELPFSKMKSLDEVSIQYSDRESDGDHIVLYERIK
jgi:CheR methyltransferase, SAM binding domain